MPPNEIANSSYESLIKLCYQLRHENEELMEAVNLKSVYGDTCGREIDSLREKLRAFMEKRSTETEKNLSEHMQLSEDRLRLMKENGLMEERLRESESRLHAVTAELGIVREEVEILLTQINESSKTPSVISSPPAEDSLSRKKLEEENDRLKKELETAQFLLANSENAKRQKIQPPSPTTPTASVTMSSEDSLLRLFESIVGYSVVKANNSNILTLVSHTDRKTCMKFVVSESNPNEVSLASSESIDESALGVLNAFNSIPSFIAKCTLVDVTKRFFLKNSNP